jgi:PD-(D/E)XK nuclease superfamily
MITAMVNRLDPLHTNIRSRPPGNQDYFFTETDLLALQEMEERKVKHVYQNRISPSDLIFDMCPRQYIRLDAQTRRDNSSDDLERMEFGKQLHSLYLGRAKRSKNFLYPKEKIQVPDLIKETNKRKDWAEELEKRWPSFMVVDEFDFLSGEIDCAMDLHGGPVIIDLKFPQEHDPTVWKTKLELIPSDQYVTQLCVYAWIANKYGYFDKPVEKVGLVVRNPFQDKKKVQTTKEVYIDFTPELQEKTTIMIEALYAELRLYLGGEKKFDKKEPCLSSLCKVHHAPKPPRKRRQKDDSSVSG